MRKKEYTLPHNEIRRLHRRSFLAQQKDHSEVCGVMLVDQQGFIELVFVTNQSEKPYRYEMDTNRLRNISREAKKQGKAVLGSFHSHPVGEPFPGDGDLSGGFFKKVELIYDVCGREARLWELLGTKKVPKGYRELHFVRGKRRR